MKISELLTSDRILLDVKCKDKESLLNQVIQAFCNITGITNVAELIEEVKQREALGNTGIGRGIGFPHARSKIVSEISIMLIKPAVPIEYASLDGQPVSIVVLIIAPEDGDNNQYLHTMAKISRLLGNNEVRTKILAAKTPQEIIDIIVAMEK